MTNVDLSTLSQFLLPDLGEVTLAPYLSPGSNPPNLTPPAPAVTGSPSLIPSAAYRWNYNDVRYLRLGYVLQRDGEYESGEFDILSQAVRQASINPKTYQEPRLAFSQTVLLSTGPSLGVEFSVATDSLSVSAPQFGLAYAITNATPAVYPTLRVFVIKLLPL